MGKHIYILHGYNATPADHWFPWLKANLESDGHSVTVHSMPNTSHPHPDEWLAKLASDTNPFNQDTFFVTHSLGSINLLHYLSRLKEIPLFGGFILVSGFNESLPTLPSLDPFIHRDIAWRDIISATLKRVVIAAKDDCVVPFPLSQRLATLLDSQFIATEKGGHFLKSDGFTSFPLVYDILTEMMK